MPLFAGPLWYSASGPEMKNNWDPGPFCEVVKAFGRNFRRCLFFVWYKWVLFTHDGMLRVFHVNDKERKQISLNIEQRRCHQILRLMLSLMLEILHKFHEHWNIPWCVRAVPKEIEKADWLIPHQVRASKKMGFRFRLMQKFPPWKWTNVTWKKQHVTTRKGFPSQHFSGAILP